MKNKGFTLVELLAVIVILGILITIAVPSMLGVSKNVKEKSYTSKIDLIESAAVIYGEKNSIDILKEMISKKSAASGNKVWIKVTDDSITSVDATDTGAYPAVKTTVAMLVGTGNLSWDKEDQCSDDSSQCKDYKNVIINPVNNKVINKCEVFIYYRNNRVYAKFNRDGCKSIESTNPYK
jgi:prepilin-type N-terminal cleavage/methylation domain-containing protein